MTTHDGPAAEHPPASPVPRERAVQRARQRLPVAVRPLPLPSIPLRALTRRALPVAASIATTAMATVAAERALARAATRLLPAAMAGGHPSNGARRVVITERVEIERFRVRR